MSYDAGFSRRSASEREIQPVAIVSVDPTNRTAIGVTRVRSRVTINCSYATGDTITTPATGEQWYIERFDMEWRLYGRIPFNDETLNIKAEEGQVSVGSARGPLELNGPEVRINSKVFRLNGVYYRDSGEALERSADQVTWTAVSAATASTLAQELASALAGYQGTDSTSALLAIKDWSALVQLIVDNFSQFWNLLCDNSFVTGLKGLGFGDTDLAKIIDGFQNFLNYLFSTVFCDFNGDITPQVLLARIRDLLAPIASNPFVLALQEFSMLLGGTGNGLLQDAIDGVTRFLQTLFDVLFCQADPTELQAILSAVGDVFGPVSIIQAIESFFDVFRDNLFLQGLSSFLQSIAPGLFTGNLLQDAVIGGTKFLGTLFGVLTCDPTALTTLAGFFNGTPGLTTPQGILATLAGLVTDLMSNPLIVAIQSFASQYLGLTGTLLQQIITGTGDLFNWFFKALTTFLPFVPWQALLPFLNWTAINDATVPGINWPAMLTTNLFNMFDSLFSGLLGYAEGAFTNFITNLGNLLNGMGLIGGVLDLDGLRSAIEFFLTNILGIATRGLDGVLQFGGTIVSNVLGAVGNFFENIAEFFGFDLRTIVLSENFNVFEMAILFFENVKEALVRWIRSFVLGGSGNLVEWAQANILVPVIGNFLTGLKIDWRTLGYSTVDDLLSAGWSSLSQIAGKLLTSLTQIPANLISGVLPPGILGTVPVSSIADVSQNLLAQGAFADGVSVEANDGWIWDSTQSATGTGGSVKVTVSPAKNRYLYARQAVPVAAGDRLIVNATIKTSGLLLNNVSNTPISISIIPYAGSTQASSAIQIGSASGPSSSWTTIGNSKASPYTVTDSTWTSIIVQLKVDSSTYSGTVWWDDITVAKTGALLQNNVDSLVAAWNSTISGLYGQGTPGNSYDWTSLFSAAAQARGRAETGISNNATTVSVLGTSPQSYITNLSGVNADGVRSIATLLQYLITTLGDPGALGALGTDVLALYYAAAQARARANLGVTTADNTNTALANNPGSLINSLYDVKADGARSIGTMLNYLVSTLKNPLSTYTFDVASLYWAALEARNQANLGVTRAEGTNTVLFGTTTTGTQVKTTALNTTGANGIGAAIVPGAGAGGTMWRTSTTPVAALGGRHKFSEHSGFFGSASASTTEITVSSSTATFTVARAGWYIAEISFAVGVGGTTGFNASPLLYKNGTAYRVGPDAIQTATRTNRYSQSSFIVYLNAGGTLTAGYDVDATTGTPQFNADVAGTMTTFSVALMNPTF